MARGPRVRRGVTTLAEVIDSDLHSEGSRDAGKTRGKGRICFAKRNSLGYLLATSSLPNFGNKGKALT